MQRKKNGQFKKKRGDIVLERWKNGKRRLCACCKLPLYPSQYKNASFCRDCGRYIERLVRKYNKRSSRIREELRQWKEIGTLGRVKQMIAWNKKKHRIINRLRCKVKYYKNKGGKEK